MSSPIEQLVDAVKGRLALGPAAGPLLQGLIGLIFSEPNGLKGFLDKFAAAGLGAQASSWIGDANSPPLAPQGVVHAFGSDTIMKLASKVGLDNGVVTAALGYVTPKIIGMLTAGGAIPTTIPSAFSAFLGAGPGAAAAAPPRPVSPAATPTPAVAPMAGKNEGMQRWILPAVVIVLALALLVHFLGGKHEPAPPVPPAPPAQHQ